MQNGPAMQTPEPTQLVVIIPRKNLVRGALILLLASPLSYYAMWAAWLHTWTPGIELLVPIPDGYQDIRAFRAARTHDFPALHGKPPPGPVAGSGHLLRITDERLYGTETTETGQNRRPEVKTLHIERVFGPDIIAHLDVPLRPDLQEHLQSLRKGAIVTIAGIGHGDGEHNVYIYPVHQVNAHAP